MVFIMQHIHMPRFMSPACWRTPAGAAGGVHILRGICVQGASPLATLWRPSGTLILPRRVPRGIYYPRTTCADFEPVPTGGIAIGRRLAPCSPINNEPEPRQPRQRCAGWHNPTTEGDNPEWGAAPSSLLPQSTHRLALQAERAVCSCIFLRPLARRKPLAAAAAYCQSCHPSPRVALRRGWAPAD